MTSFDESGRFVLQLPGAGSLPRLFGDAEGAAVQGLGGGIEGLGGWVDRGHPRARGQAPASRDELAALILRYREEQAAGGRAGASTSEAAVASLRSSVC